MCVNSAKHGSEGVGDNGEGEASTADVFDYDQAISPGVNLSFSSPRGVIRAVNP